MTTQIVSTPPQPITNKDVLFFIRDRGFVDIPEMAKNFNATSGERLSQLTATVEALVAVGQVKREGRGTFRVKIMTETVRLTLAEKGELTEQEIVDLFLPQASPGERGSILSMVHSTLSALLVPIETDERDKGGKFIVLPPKVVQVPRHRQAPAYKAA